MTVQFMLLQVHKKTLTCVAHQPTIFIQSYITFLCASFVVFSYDLDRPDHMKYLMPLLYCGQI